MIELAEIKNSLQNNDFEEANEQSRKYLETDPENASAWHLCGISAAQLGDFDDAVECFEKATQHNVESSLYPYNLALALQKTGELDRSIEAYETAIGRKADFLEARANLGNVLVQQGQMLKAASVFESLVKEFPQSSDAHFNLANTLNEIGRGDEAIKHYHQAIELNPDLSAARENLGRAYTDVHEVVEARNTWESWLQHEPGNEFAKHMLAAASDDTHETPDRCSDECVRQQFNDDFAVSFDDQLSRLDYQTPTLIQAAIDALEPPIMNADILDAGCGTGLCGPSLRPIGKSLVGIDLSSAMLGEATKRDVYDDIIEAEITEFMQSRPEAFDLVVCSDTLCYFGDLSPFFQSAMISLRTGGRLVFSVEKDTETELPDSIGYRLQLHGRYCHTESYLREIFDRFGLMDVTITCAVQRNEGGRPVEGFIASARLA